jgi:hypothetical protein
MKIASLETTLTNLGVMPSAYSIGSESNESYVILCENGIWRVFYSERGQRTGELCFDIEEEAVADFLQRVTHDDSARA